MAERIRRYEDDLVLQAREARRVVGSNGNIGVFWLAREPAELKRFLELIGPAALQLVHAVRLDTIRPTRAASAEQTYLLVLQPIPDPALEVAVDAEKVLSLAADGALSLYDGLAELFEAALEPEELDDLIADEGSGSSRRRLAGFLASQSELEQVLIDRIGRPNLLRELVHRGASRQDLRAMDTRGLARRLLGLLGFAVAGSARFSIREAFHDCENAARRLELADSAAAVREAFLAGFNGIEAILRYTVYSWAYLECGDQWEPVFERVIGSAKHSYPGPARLSFGHLHVLFRNLPTTFAANDQEPGNSPFSRIPRALKKAKVRPKAF